MKLITRDTDYAVRALVFMIKHKNRVISVPELVKALKIPRPFLRKILQRLNIKGVLESHKGQGGGFVLLEPAGRISLAELMEVFQGPLQLNDCLFKKKLCPNRGTCPLRQKICNIEKNVISELGAISIASLARKGG